MKTRLGFVANSSSSSFLIYGVGGSLEDIFEKIGYTITPDEDRWTVLDKLASDLDLAFYYNSDGEFGAIGKSWSKVSDDQTGRQFKEEVETKIKSVAKKDDIQFGTYEDSWYNG